MELPWAGSHRWAEISLKWFSTKQCLKTTTGTSQGRKFIESFQLRQGMGGKCERRKRFTRFSFLFWGAKGTFLCLRCGNASGLKLAVSSVPLKCAMCQMQPGADTQIYFLCIGETQACFLQCSSLHPGFSSHLHPYLAVPVPF